MLRERERGGEKLSYDEQLYTKRGKGKYIGNIYGFPLSLRPWCNDRLKLRSFQNIERKTNLRKDVLSYTEISQPERENSRVPCLTSPVVQFETQTTLPSRSRFIKGKFSKSPKAQGAKKNIVLYLGIAADEPKRIERHAVPGKVLPLVDIGWDEAYCRQWCQENNLLSPIYTTATRGGCWFCHNQGVDQLRLLRKDYPELWQMLLKWDNDSPTTFKPDGHTVHDFEKRFMAEDNGLIKAGDKGFRWKQVLNEENNEYSQEE